MARGRMLNKSISVSKKMHLLPDDTCRLLATWTIAHLDKNGVFYADPVIVKSLVFPRRGDISTEQVELYLVAMQRAGLVILFTAQDQLWQYWPGFADNQTNLRPDRENTDFPAPVNNQATKEALSESADEFELPDDNDSELPEDCHHSAGKIPAQSPPKIKEINTRQTNTTSGGGSRNFSDADLLEVSSAYESNIGFISPIASDELKDMLSTYSREWIIDAFKVAVKANKRRLNYIWGILRKWQTEGRGDNRQNGNGPPGDDSQERVKKVAIDKATGKPL